MGVLLSVASLFDEMFDERRDRFLFGLGQPRIGEARLERAR